MTFTTRTAFVAASLTLGIATAPALADTPLEVAPTIQATATDAATPWPVYEGPGTENDIRARVTPGATVQVSGCLEDASWCAVSSEEFSGWMAAAAIDTGNTVPATITVDWEHPLTILVEEKVVPQAQIDAAETPAPTE